MTRAFHADTRTVLRLSGADHRKFLQDLVTNNVNRLTEGPVYAALLTPQGKYLADFLLIADGATTLLDADTGQAPDLIRRLGMYRLRADVQIEATALKVFVGIDGAAPEGAVTDPRTPALGWRLYGETTDLELAPELATTWDRLRIELGVPAAGKDLLPNDSYILEAGFDRLNGVDFRKGCYVGQEVTARMRHKTELRKGLARVRLSGEAPPAGTAIERDGKTVGTLYSSAGDLGLAHLRFDRAGPGMRAGAAEVSVVEE